MLRTRRALYFVGIISALAIWWVWGAFSPLPLVQDEVSYVLQSRIFATGRWTAPSPPLHGFFQQPHVLTFPAVASKYAPGHALLMTPGALIGWPALVPLLLTTITGAWLLALAAAIGWGAITRPLTMLAFAVPIGVVVIRDTVREHSWRDLTCAMALGIVMLGVIPLWSARTTGNWRLTPQTLYTRDYLPFDHPGFGLDRTRPLQPLARPDFYVYAASEASTNATRRRTCRGSRSSGCRPSRTPNGAGRAWCSSRSCSLASRR